jgi:CRP-like cAMP-binding protein
MSGERAEFVAVLRAVEYLACLDDATLDELAARATPRTYKKGQRIVSELESGADVFVVTKGEAEVFVEPRAGERQVLGKLGAGGAFGEMASLTGELRSASVTALGDVEVLVLADAEFDSLRARRPEVAAALARMLGRRIAGAEQAIDALLDPAASSQGPAAQVAQAKSGLQTRRGSVARAWRELVVNRRRELPFLTLAGFVGTLAAVRALVYLAFRFDFFVRDVLRAAYLTGFTLLGVSALLALLTFRPSVRRFVALAYGIGCALIFNELGVTLAFDIFFKDIHTPDPTVPFDIERLYRRTEPLRAIVVAVIALIQAAYLRRFYRRAFFVAKTRARKLFART